MAQKSLSILHRVDTSMIWTSFFHEKKFKWLSFNIWFFFLYFYKNYFFFNIKKNYHYFTNSTNFLNFKKIPKNINNSKLRFSYYINLYCIEWLNYLILLNLYFKTNLRFYKKKQQISKTTNVLTSNFFNN
jgi:hypothetical protein